MVIISLSTIIYLCVCLSLSDLGLFFCFQSKEECIFDGLNQVGVCGDWLTKPCIEGAAVSGLALAEKINKHYIGIYNINIIHNKLTLYRWVIHYSSV